MKKTVTAIFLIMLLGFIFVGAESEISPFAFTSYEEPVFSLSGGMTVTASVTVNEKSDVDSYTLLLVNTCDNKVIGISADTGKYTDGPLALCATLTLPDDVTGNQLTAMLWDGVDSVIPLRSAALLPGYIHGLKYIKLNGSLLQDFNGETEAYKIAVDSLAFSQPVIGASVIDGAADVKIRTTKRFPGKAVIDVISPEKDTLSYVLQYESETALCDELSYTGPKENPEDENESKLIHNLQSGEKAYASVSSVTVENIPERIKGASYIMADMPIEEKSTVVREAWSGEDICWYSFNLQRTAEIIIFSEDEIPKLNEENGWSKDPELSIEKLEAEKGSYLKLSNAYVKKYEVSENSKTVNIPNPSVETGDFFVVINYVYGSEIYPILDEPDYISELRYGGPYVSGEEYFFDQPKYFKNFNNGDLLLKNYSELIAKDVSAELLDNDRIMISNPITGATPTFVKNGWGGGNFNWVSFKLHKSAEVKVVVNSGNIKALINAGFTEKKSDGVWLNLHNNTWNTDTPWNTMYSKLYEVSEEPVTVNIPNPNGQGNRWGYIILIDYLE